GVGGAWRSLRRIRVRCGDISVRPRLSPVTIIRPPGAARSRRTRVQRRSRVSPTPSPPEGEPAAWSSALAGALYAAWGGACLNDATRTDGTPGNGDSHRGRSNRGDHPFLGRGARPCLGLVKLAMQARGREIREIIDDIV